MNYNYITTFKVNSPASMETSNGVLDSSEEEELEITVGVDSEAEYGYFEVYDIYTQGNRFYGEGGLWFTNNKLVDYDGVFELSQHVINQLKKWKFDTSEME